jgi:hypothetical protein
MAPNGHAPERNPYTLERRQPRLNARMNDEPRRSRLYMSIMNVRATTPYTVIAITASVADGWPRSRPGNLTVLEDGAAAEAQPIIDELFGTGG